MIKTQTCFYNEWCFCFDLRVWYLVECNDPAIASGSLIMVNQCSTKTSFPGSFLLEGEEDPGNLPIPCYFCGNGTTMCIG